MRESLIDSQVASRLGITSNFPTRFAKRVGTMSKENVCAASAARAAKKSNYLYGAMKKAPDAIERLMAEDEKGGKSSKSRMSPDR